LNHWLRLAKQSTNAKGLQRDQTAQQHRGHTTGAKPQESGNYQVSLQPWASRRAIGRLDRGRSHKQGDVSDLPEPNQDAGYVAASAQWKLQFGECIFGMFYVVYPFGKILAVATRGDYLPFLKKHRDAEGFARPVTLQLTATDQKIAPGQMRQWLTTEGTTLADPNTLKPIAWDGEASHIKFQSQRGTSDQPDVPILYVAQIP
jgi:hypothetical protein